MFRLLDWGHCRCRCLWQVLWKDVLGSFRRMLRMETAKCWQWRQVERILVFLDWKWPIWCGNWLFAQDFINFQHFSLTSIDFKFDINFSGGPMWWISGVVEQRLYPCRMDECRILFCRQRPATFRREDMAHVLRLPWTSSERPALEPRSSESWQLNGNSFGINSSTQFFNTITIWEMWDHKNLFLLWGKFVKTHERRPWSERVLRHCTTCKADYVYMIYVYIHTLLHCEASCPWWFC